MKNRSPQLSQYIFNWNLLEVILSGKSALDADSFLEPLTSIDQAHSFMSGYGFEVNNPIEKAELFGSFQEAVQFIRRYFLKEGNPYGLPLDIPHSILTITNITDLFLMGAATSANKKYSYEDRLWAGIVMKVMHTILHTDRDLRHNYFGIIQQQIFDRYYKYLLRDDNKQLFLGRDNLKIPLVDFQTKSKKSRDSIIIKLLHKAENVAEELFDRVGIRFVTFNKLDAVRVVKFLQENHVLIAHNIKPSRSRNNLINLSDFRKKHNMLLKSYLRGNISEADFIKELDVASNESKIAEDETNVGKNEHTSREYRSIQFTCRQLIKYTNPLVSELNSIRDLAKENKTDPLATKVLQLDYSKLVRDLRFFYSYEVQIVSLEEHKINTEGEAAHSEYKRQQLKTAMLRIFRPLIKYKNLKVD